MTITSLKSFLLRFHGFLLTVPYAYSYHTPVFFPCLGPWLRVSILSWESLLVHTKKRSLNDTSAPFTFLYDMLQCTSKNFSKRTDYIIETKNANISEKIMFLTIFVKKSFFFRLKKKIWWYFFVEVTKKIKNEFTRWN